VLPDLIATASRAELSIEAPTGDTKAGPEGRAISMLPPSPAASAAAAAIRPILRMGTSFSIT
jgi:hypothetical protein